MVPAQADWARCPPGTERPDPSSHKRLKRRKNTRRSPARARGCPRHGDRTLAPAPAPQPRAAGGRQAGRPAGRRPADHDRRTTTGQPVSLAKRIRRMGRRQSRPGPFDMTAFAAFDLGGTPGLNSLPELDRGPHPSWYCETLPVKCRSWPRRAAPSWRPSYGDSQSLIIREPRAARSRS